MQLPLDPATIRPLKRLEYDKLVRQGVFENDFTDVTVRVSDVIR